MRVQIVVVASVITVAACPAPSVDGEGDGGDGELVANGGNCTHDDDCESGDCSDRRPPVCVPHDCDDDDECSADEVCATSVNVPWLGNQCVAPAASGDVCASFNDLAESTKHPCGGGLACAHRGAAGLSGESFCVDEAAPREFRYECDAAHPCAADLVCDFGIADWGLCLLAEGAACDGDSLSCASSLECGDEDVCVPR